MSYFRGFDEQENGAGILGALAGLLSGGAVFLLAEREWWAWGWGPGNWSRSVILHAWWLAFMGHVNPSYMGDLGSWPHLSAWLRSHHQYDAFVASFWVPFLIGTSVGILAAWFLVRAVNRRGPAYVRGSRINQ